LERVSAYHRRNRIRLPNPRLHSTIHAIIENQIAEGMAKTRDALARLISEGLSRHDAIHAIGSVLSR
jgi:hypothetical protein